MYTFKLAFARKYVHANALTEEMKEENIEGKMKKGRSHWRAREFRSQTSSDIEHTDLFR